MDDRQKLRNAQERIAALEKENNFLHSQVTTLQNQVRTFTQPMDRQCYLTRIEEGDAKKGFNYPSKCLNIWIDWRDGSVWMILPKPENENHKAEP